MKTLFNFKAAVFLIALLIFISCKKNDPMPADTTSDYGVDSLNTDSIQAADTTAIIADTINRDTITTKVP